MKDCFGRNIDYLRISLTDRCNLRCKYCMPECGVDLMRHEDILSLEEIVRIVDIMNAMGVTKVRLTGGEPMVRKNVVKLVEDLHSFSTIEYIAMTTNGLLFEPKVEELVNAGLTAVNISLDTLDEERFRAITGMYGMEIVFRALQKSCMLGLRTKINCVPVRELNDADLEDLAGFAKKLPVDVRFIELMPIGCGKEYEGIPSDEILDRLARKYGPYEAFAGKRGNGPAKYVEFSGFLGKIGLISPMSHAFCGECNRIRLTADGWLKLCLHYDIGVDLKTLLRDGSSDTVIKEVILEALEHKPQAHHFAAPTGTHEDVRKMVQIGG
ncbi:MAG: GTP 3',8-cyclase MoaA [Lachnospiraceae bacterium]|nr:GTP 3',8-cyclase MoaA [Lachnospiraceae bacterium]